MGMRAANVANIIRSMGKMFCNFHSTFTLSNYDPTSGGVRELVLVRVLRHELSVRATKLCRFRVRLAA